MNNVSKIINVSQFIMFIVNRFGGCCPTLNYEQFRIGYSEWKCENPQNVKRNPQIWYFAKRTILANNWNIANVAIFSRIFYLIDSSHLNAPQYNKRIFKLRSLNKILKYFCYQVNNCTRKIILRTYYRQWNKAILKWIIWYYKEQEKHCFS